MDELIKALNETDFSDGCPCEAESLCDGKDCVIIQGADAIAKMSAELKRVKEELTVCRNELCLRCGQYKTRHLGSCDGCRWLK